MKQIVGHKPIGTIAGIALVIGLIAVILALNLFAQAVLLPLVGGKFATLAFYVLGALVALLVLRVYALRFVYEANDDVLRISRAYGKRERFVEDIYLNQLLFVGNPEEAKQRWAGAKRINAVYSKKGVPATAVVYKASNGNRVALIQANDELLAKLRARLKKG